MTNLAFPRIFECDKVALNIYLCIFVYEKYFTEFIDLMVREISRVIFLLSLFTFLTFHLVLGKPGQSWFLDSSLTRQKDVIDLFRKASSRDLQKDSSKFKNNGPYLSVMPVVGYSLQSGLTGAIVSNTSFYTDDSRNKISNIILNAYYSQYHQFWFTANTNIFFESHKIHLFGDIRYYNFPTQTFGFGTKSLMSEALDIKFSYLRFYQYIFREIRNNLYLGLGYNLDHHWNIRPDSIPGRVLNDLKRYQKTDYSTSSGVSLNLLFDSRRNAVNPDNGTYAYIQFRPNLTLLGSDKNWQSLMIDLRHYIRLPESSGNVLAFWNYNNFTLNGTAPYLDMPSVGWDYYSNTGRGYVPGRYTGRNFVYLESEYRYKIIRNGLLGGVVFGNMETFFSKTIRNRTFIPGGGVGIRIKINKFSNTNLAIDYGFGVEGSRGFFFNLGEVF
jgi:hypothetical protein